MKNRLKVYRAMHDLTQEELAEKVEVTRQTINAVEQGKYLPSLKLAFRLAKIFNVQIEDIFYEDGDDTDEIKI
ncbi:MAG TPA: helix-turn-helix transcriptional regulator [Halobacteria archaeon]|nr:helix-turn-helix transcriptional regulator [Halobacteria archaeon]